MICRCPECNGALEYNPSMQNLTCKFCGNFFRPDNVNKESKNDGATGELDSKKEVMECKIYTCTSCAGELVVNDIELSTFCPYCGQPTIVFDRVSKEEKPKYIIPFSISKEEAIENIRLKLKYSHMCPKQVKQVNEEQVKGIYVPYYLMNLYYYDKQKIGVENKHGLSRYFDREAECEFVNVPCDASFALPDELSQGIDPFDLEQLKPFDESYLSGFYADMFNGSEAQMEYAVWKRCEAWFNENMKKSCSLGESDKVFIEESQPKVKILSHEYALMPIYFYTFSYKNSFYTIIVNGQTGKEAGTLPFNIQKLIFCYIAVFLGCCGLISPFAYYIVVSSPEDSIMFLLCIWVLAIIILNLGVYLLKKAIEKIKYSQNHKLAKLVRERQERS